MIAVTATTSPDGAPAAAWAAGRPLPDIRGELPGPRARALLARDQQVTSPSLTRAYPLVPRRGAGVAVEDVDGNLFLDFNAGIAVASTGHAHPAVVEAVRCQATELLHYSASDFYLPVYVDACEALARVAPMRGPVRVMLTNSGTEAVEGALKLARYATGRQYVVSFYGAFHGRSYGALSLTASKARQHAGFGPLLPGVLRAPYGASGYLEEVLFRYEVDPGEVAAVFVEPVQGEGGYVVPPPGWLAELRATCERHGILLVADEVQSGAGRTGRMWAVEHWGVEPDVLCTAKGIASGMPLGGVIARADLWRWPPGAHGSTYGGNPLACAAALATLRVIEEEGLVGNAAARGAELLAGLADLQARYPQLVTGVRGLGLMIGLELASGELAAAVEAACFRRGLLVLRAGERVVRLCPPLIVTAEQCATALRLLAAALEACASA